MLGSSPPSTVTVLSAGAMPRTLNRRRALRRSGLPATAGQPHHDFARAHVGQVAERIHRHDVLHVVGVALRRDRERVTLALARDLEGVQTVDAAGKLKIPHHAVPATDRDLGANGIEPNIGCDDFVDAGRQAGEDKSTGVVGEGRQPSRGHLQLGAFEQIAGGGIADRAGDRADSLLGRARQERCPRQERRDTG